jgi:hypothetical protein
LRAYPRCDQKTAIQFIDYTLAKLPFAVERIQNSFKLSDVAGLPRVVRPVV